MSGIARLGVSSVALLLLVAAIFWLLAPEQVPERKPDQLPLLAGEAPRPEPNQRPALEEQQPGATLPASGTRRRTDPPPSGGVDAELVTLLADQATSAEAAADRISALQQLAELPPTSLSRKSASRATRDRVPEVRRESILTLIRIGDRSVLPYLNNLAEEDEREEIRQLARQAIDQIKESNQ